MQREIGVGGEVLDASGDDWLADRIATRFHAMLDQGRYLPPSGYECWFLSAAHDQSVLDRIVDALPKAAAAARKAL